MRTSGNFLLKNPPNYFSNSGLEIHRVVYSEQTLHVDKNYNFCRISQINTSPWNISGNITIQNVNNSTNCQQAVSSCNGSYLSQPICKHDSAGLLHHNHPSSRNPRHGNILGPGPRPVLHHHKHGPPAHKPSNHGAVLPVLFQQPDFSLPHCELEHYLSPPAYFNLRQGKSARSSNLPRQILPHSSQSPNSVPQPEIVPTSLILTVPQRRVAPPSEFLTESEIDNWVLKIAEEANSHTCVLTWPEKGRTGIGGDEREPRAAIETDQGVQHSRRLRKQAKPRCSAQRYDPNFKGMVLEMHIKVENRKCQLRIKSSLGIKLSSLRLGNDDGHTGRRSCCSIDEQPSGKIRVVRPQGGKRVLRYGKECQSCGARRTQLWRKSENGKLLCNMCGIRYMKYRVRCRRCWHVPKCNSKMHSKCGCCGSSLCYVVTRQNMIHCKP